MILANMRLKCIGPLPICQSAFWISSVGSDLLNDSQGKEAKQIFRFEFTQSVTKGSSREGGASDEKKLPHLKSQVLMVSLSLC